MLKALPGQEQKDERRLVEPLAVAEIGANRSPAPESMEVIF